MLLIIQAHQTKGITVLVRFSTVYTDESMVIDGRYRLSI